MGKIFEFIATGGYIGKINIAPATFGSLVSIPLIFITYINPLIIILTFSSLLMLGILSSNYMVDVSGERDPKCVVIDEITAFYMVFFPQKPDIWFLILGFLIFRILDIIKPFPARLMERLPKGWGIMLDDIVAGVYAFLLLKIIHLIPL